MEASKQIKPAKKTTSMSLKRKLKRDIDDLRKQKAVEEEKRRLQRENMQREIENSRKQKAAEEERRKLQREVLKKQAAALFEKQKERNKEETPLKVIPISIPTPKSYSDIPEDSPFADRMRIAVDDQHRKDQREGLLRQASELLRKKESEGKPLWVSNKVNASSPARPLKAEVFESLLIKEQKRKEHQERDSEEQDEDMEQERHRDVMPSPLAHSLNKPRSQSFTPMKILNPEVKKVVSEEKRRKEQREVLRRQAAELITRNGGDTSFLLRSEDDQADPIIEMFPANKIQGGNKTDTSSSALGLPSKSRKAVVDHAQTYQCGDNNVYQSIPFYSQQSSSTNSSNNIITEKEALYFDDRNSHESKLPLQDRSDVDMTKDSNLETENGNLEDVATSTGTTQTLSNVNNDENTVQGRESRSSHHVMNAGQSNDPDDVNKATPVRISQTSSVAYASPRNLPSSAIAGKSTAVQSTAVALNSYSETTSSSSPFPYSPYYPPAMHTTAGLPPYYHGSYLTYPPYLSYLPNYAHYPILGPYGGAGSHYSPYPPQISYSSYENHNALEYKSTSKVQTIIPASQTISADLGQINEAAGTQKENDNIDDELGTGANHSESTPAVPSKKPKHVSSLAKKCFSPNPMSPPSPFALSHVLVRKPVIVVKKNGETFGITLSMVVESALVPLDYNEDINGEVSNQNNGDSLNQQSVDNCATSEVSVPNPNANTADSKKRRRRKRVFFTAMTVVDPSVQNARKLAMNETVADEENTTIQKGDILLSINGSTTAGLTFAAACELFAKCNTEGEDGMVRCSVEVATTIVESKVDIKLEEKKNEISSISSRCADIVVLAQTDFVALATSVLKALLDISRRFIGSSLSYDDVKHYLPATTLSLTKVPASRLRFEWEKLADNCQQDATNRADSYWKNNNAGDFSINDLSTLTRTITEAKLSLLRAAPRPSDGSCRCGSQNHQYVNHPLCFLYSKLRHLDTSDEGNDTTEQEKKKRKLISSVGDMNTVEKAFTDSILRRKSESEAEELEARFVDRMEMIQVRRCNQAVFAPSLEAIVLSAVAELSMKHGDDYLATNKTSDEISSDKQKSSSTTGNDSDDDDDVPLALLGKLSSELERYDTLKNQIEAKLSHHYLAKLVRFVSEKWGHVYYEPSHLEYAWRWEVFHGSVGTQKWIAGAKNQREVNSLSLENVRFLLSDEEISGFAQPENSDSYLTAVTALAHVLSPQQTGICDELLSLLYKDILMIDESRGILSLTEDWCAKVDVTLLEDMQLNWGISVDPVGKYGIIEEVRKLSDHWDRTAEGWLLKEEKEIVFLFDELREWRKAFEHKHQVLSEGKDGIGKFY